MKQSIRDRLARLRAPQRQGWKLDTKPDAELANFAGLEAFPGPVRLDGCQLGDGRYKLSWRASAAAVAIGLHGQGMLVCTRLWARYEAVVERAVAIARSKRRKPPAKQPGGARRQTANSTRL